MLDDRQCSSELAKDAAREKYDRLMELAELDEGELGGDRRANADLAMERVIRLGTVCDCVKALGLYIGYLHFGDLLEERKA